MMMKSQTQELRSKASVEMERVKSQKANEIL